LAANAFADGVDPPAPFKESGWEIPLNFSFLPFFFSAFKEVLVLRHPAPENHLPLDPSSPFFGVRRCEAMLFSGCFNPSPVFL